VLKNLKAALSTVDRTKCHAYSQAACQEFLDNIPQANMKYKHIVQAFLAIGDNRIYQDND